MNKYSLSKLDTQMTFNNTILSTLYGELSILNKIKSVDDYVFTLEILNIENLDNSRLEKILKNIITFCSKSFWHNLRFTIDEITINTIKIDRFTNVMVDLVMIELNQKEIFMEVFIYHGAINLYSIILISKKSNSLKPEEKHVHILQM